MSQFLHLSLLRKCDDSNKAQFDRCLVGAIPILRCGLAPELSPARCVKTAIRGLAEKTWSHPVTGRDAHFRAVTIERWYYMAQRQCDDPVGALAAPAQGLRQGIPLRCCRGATHAPVPQLPTLELPTALRQSGRFSEGQSLTGNASLLFHDQGLHAGSRPVRKPTPRPKGRPPSFSEAPDCARSAATKPSMSGRCGTSISTTDRSKCSLRAASGCGRLCWASSTIIRDYAATSSGISRRPPRTWCMASPRRSRSVACHVRC